VRDKGGEKTETECVWEGGGAEVEELPEHLPAGDGGTRSNSGRKGSCNFLFLGTLHGL